MTHYSCNPPRRTQPVHRSGGRTGFSLLELMVSIALVLIIILGVNQVFGLSSKTVGAGQALSDTHRDGRNAQSVFSDDARGAASALPDAPCLIIRSQGVYAFRNKADFDSDVDQDPGTQDLQQSGTETGFAPYLNNDRRHRLDQLFMFARGINHRQTGTGGSFGDAGSSFESYIVYGHLALPDNSNPLNYRVPGEVKPGGGPSDWQSYNPHNYFASQWILGRSVFLLDPAPPAGTAYYKRDFTKFSPLAPKSQATTGEPLADSRYDLCQTSIDLFRQVIAADDDPLNPFWVRLAAGSAPNVPVRFLGNPLPPRPLSSADAAHAVPCFLRGCTQFIVEYAGDFCTQDPATGQVVSSEPDGITDYVFDDSAGPAQPVVRRTRWYGFPRDVTDDGFVDPKYDVVPLVHFLSDPSTAKAGAPIVAPAWERVYPNSKKRYATMTADDYYVAAWGPDTVNGPKPTMLRITAVLDDPDGRIGAGQSFEYVLKLQ